MKPTCESVNTNVKALCLALAGLLLWACPAAAVPDADPLSGARHVKLTYTVYLGGLYVMDSDAEFTRKGQGYTLNMNARTRGFLRSLAPWDADLSSHGVLKAAHVQPLEGRVTTKWKDRAENVTFTFDKKDKDNVAVKFDPPEGESKHEPVPEDMKRDVLDPLNGVVQILANFAYWTGCNQTIPVYDGHRRFDIVMDDRGREALQGEDYSVFTGMAAKCEARLTMRAGSRKDREGSRFWEDADGKSSRPPVYIYLAKVRPDLPPLPVRAETSTVFGSIVIHLKDVPGV